MSLTQWTKSLINYLSRLGFQVLGELGFHLFQCILSRHICSASKASLPGNGFKICSPGFVMWF